MFCRRTQAGRVTENLKYDLFIPNLVKFIIIITLRGDMYNCYISIMVPS